jgi:phosphoglycolate phosphatase-like HAD superfamily hydrolase
MEYPVLIAVDHDGKKYKPGGKVDMTAEQAAPLIRSGFIGAKSADTEQTDFAAVANTAVKLQETLQALASEQAGAEGEGEQPSPLDRVVEAIGKIDPAKTELFTGSGKPKTEAVEAVEGIDFPVSAALRDQAWDQFQKQQTS